MLVHDIGQAMAAARKRLGLSLEALAESTSLDVALLGRAERGEQLLSTAKLDRIASVLGIDAFALYEGREVERGLVVLPRYASTRGDFQHEDVPVLSGALEQAAALVAVSALLGRNSLASHFEPSPPGTEPAQAGYHFARRVRKALGSITEPLGDLSTLLADRFDVPVVVAPLATWMLQAAAVRSSASHAGAVVLNSAVKGGPMPRSYQAWLVDRVSICHELCHILFDEPRGGVDVVLDDDPRAGQDRSAIEQRAGAFAAEMLIPLLGLKHRLGEGRQVDTPGRADEIVDEVRSYFRTPAEIAVNHLYNHGYIAKVAAFRAELIVRAQSREIAPPAEWSAPEAEAWRGVLEDRVRDAHRAYLISDGTVRALLGLELGTALPWEHDGR